MRAPLSCLSQARYGIAWGAVGAVPRASFQLRVVEGPDEGHEAAVTGTRFTLGRLKSCGLTLSDTTVSRTTAAGVMSCVPWVPSAGFNAASNGFPILNQRVGANFPLMVSTNGSTNQWHFYVVTNQFGYTNFAVITFLPPTLSIPRMGVNEREIENATRFEADIDLYVSQDPLLLELDPTVLDNADKSVTRGGSESVVFTNSALNDVYYIGVKSEGPYKPEHYRY